MQTKPSLKQAQQYATVERQLTKLYGKLFDAGDNKRGLAVCDLADHLRTQPSEEAMQKVQGWLEANHLSLTQ